MDSERIKRVPSSQIQCTHTHAYRGPVRSSILSKFDRLIPHRCCILRNDSLQRVTISRYTPIIQYRRFSKIRKSLLLNLIYYNFLFAWILIRSFPSKGNHNDERTKNCHYTKFLFESNEPFQLFQITEQKKDKCDIVEIVHRKNQPAALSQI